MRTTVVCLAIAAAAAAAAGQEGEPVAARPSAGAAAAFETQRLYLSGTGPEEPRSWEFRIDSGRGARRWRVIPVPSNWEMQGFGRYTHGKQWWQPAETAIYRTRFEAPPEFRGRRLELVFEGVMTDAEVLLNGRPVGEVHRGGFTRFSYDVSQMVRFHAANLLEVRVAEASADPSVNRAEREADYWTFGGIYRPVYLEAHPPASITRVAVDARHDGTLSVDVESVGPVAAEVRVRVETPAGEPVGEVLTAPVAPGGTRVEGRLEGIRPWSAETPVLYRLRVELVASDGEVLHRRWVRVGFRTVLLRPGEGLFVNGRRVLLKGVNRHSHWPESGRSVPAAVNRRDVELIRSMNMNAVRTAHSPPDTEFLDACDELGLYVIDELPGWHDAYDLEVGARILWEMVRRDVNHPSVILWANGNEGGWNTELEPLFARLDPQGRPVLHPGELALGFDASHYPDWTQLGRMIAAPGEDDEPAPVLLPTEILHALYDGGGGASLADFWRRLRSSGRLAGAFLWSLFDEGVVRTDKAGAIDTAGNRGADGLLGPHRQPEASFHAVRELWSPVGLVGARFTPETVEIELENRFDHTDLGGCGLRWRWLGFPRFPEDGLEAIAAPGGEGALPAAAPGEVVKVDLERPSPGTPNDAVELTALAPDGRELMVWVLADEAPEPIAVAWRERAAAVGGPAVRMERQGTRLVLRAVNGRWARFDLDTGALEELGHGERRLSLSGGAWRADGRRGLMSGLEIETHDRAAIVRAGYEGALEEVTWVFYNDGRLWLEYAFTAGAEDGEYLGVGFDYPRDQVQRLTWLGLGPYRVWRNRTAGARLGIWTTESNDSVTGQTWDYPEFPGFYAGVRWANLTTSEGTLTLAPEPGLFVGFFAPRFPGGARTAVAAVPQGITVLHRISAIGTKFHRSEALGPAAGRRPRPGPRRGGVWLTFSADSSNLGGRGDPAVASGPL